MLFRSIQITPLLSVEPLSNDVGAVAQMFVEGAHDGAWVNLTRDEVMLLIETLEEALS